MDEYYNKHYIKTDAQSRIIDAWSDGPFPDRDIDGAVCINHQGGYQFRLTLGGEENPILFDLHGVPLYKWVGGQVVERTMVERAADYAAIPAPAPTAQEKLEAQVAYTAMMTDTLLEV